MSKVPKMPVLTLSVQVDGQDRHERNDYYYEDGSKRSNVSKASGLDYLVNSRPPGHFCLRLK